MAKRFYATDENVRLDWVDVDFNNSIKNIASGFSYRVLDAKDGNTAWKFHACWIYSEENPVGVWHETPQGVADQLRRAADLIEKNIS